MKNLSFSETATLSPSSKSEDLAFCGLVMSTNIMHIFAEWSCPTGSARLNSCDWRGITCNTNNKTVSVTLANLQIIGSIPNSLSNLNDLRQLDLSNNLLYRKIPSEIGLLTNLEILNLGGNLFTSSIPSSLGYLGQLNTLSLHDNFLTGSIPSTFNKLGSVVLSFKLNSNLLVSTLPTFLGWINTFSFDLHANYFSSSIPTELCMLSNAFYIRLDNNRLTSSIPSCFTKIPFLNYLNFAHNSLTSTIPSSFASAEYLYFLMLNNNNLSGPPSLLLCDKIKLVQFYIANNNFDCYPYCQSDADWSGNTTHRCQDFQDTALYALQNSLNIISALKRIINTETYTVTFSEGSKRFISYPGKARE